MTLHKNDLIALGVSESDLDGRAEEVIGSSDETMTTAFLIVGQLDPLEISEGQLRWTKSQQALISEARSELEELRNPSEAETATPVDSGSSC